MKTDQVKSPGLPWLGGLPNPTRLLLQRELMASVGLAVVYGALAPLFCGLVGRKALGLSDMLLAILTASSMAGMLLAGVCVGLFQHTRKVTALTRVLAFVSLVLFSIALVPEGKLGAAWGQGAFLIQIMLAQTGFALIMTLRSSLWRANYPDQYRGRIVVWVTLCISLVSSACVLGFSWVMDRWHISFRWIYLVAGLSGLVGAYLFSRLRVRAEGRLLARARQDSRGRIPMWAGLSVLHSDRRFREFLAWQMLNGLSTLLVEGAVLVIIINDVFHSNWLVGGMALSALPLAITGVSGLLWARVYDRNGIFIMRTYGALVWAVGRTSLLVAVFYQSMPLVLFSRVLTGVALGLGRLNWRLGHMAFAPPEKDSLYMGAHVALSGLRGMIAPFLGIALYRLDWLGQNGILLLALTAMGQLIAACGFYHMHRRQQRTPADHSS
jgi:hypothetical protein